MYLTNLLNFCRFISVESGQDDLYYEDFCQEILQLRMLNHPNIVCLKALAMLGGRPHMVLPYMAKGDLRGYISNPEMVSMTD